VLNTFGIEQKLCMLRVVLKIKCQIYFACHCRFCAFSVQYTIDERRKYLLIIRIYCTVHNKVLGQ
jgi:hypothetical protein